MGKRLVCAIVTLCLLMTLIPTAAFAAVSVGFSTYSSKYSVGTTNAVLAKTISVSGAAITDVTTVGIRLTTTAGRVIGEKSEKPTPLNGVINAWYDVNNELGCTLSPSTTYYYKFYATISGTQYWSSQFSFTTASTGVSFSFATYTPHYSVGTTNVVLAKTISISGGNISSVTKVGVRLYSASNALLRSKSETPTASNGVINAWYDVKDELGYELFANTTYYYEFTVVYGGVTYVSPLYSFTTKPILVSSLRLNYTTLNIDITQTKNVELAVAVYPADATDKSVEWTSSNPNVAEVLSNGLLTALSVGKTTITCAALDGSGIKASCEVTVTSSITIDRVVEPTFDTDRTPVPCDLQWEAYAKDSVGDVLYCYLLEKDGALYIDSDYIASSAYSVTITEPGVYAMTVCALDSETGAFDWYKGASHTFYKPATQISMPSALTLSLDHPGNINQLKAKLLPEDCEEEAIYWNSSDESVITVNGRGVVFAVAPGTAVVTARVPGGATARAQVTVREDMSLFILPDGLETVEVEALAGVTPERVRLGDSVKTIGARAFADNVQLKYVYIPDSVQSIASDAFEGSGDATILCQSDSAALAFAQGAGYNYFCLDTAHRLPVSSITLSETAASIIKGNTLALTARVAPSDATDPTLIWTSSDDGVATVSQDGLVTAVELGTAVITCTAADGSGVSASCAVTVTPILVTEISLNANSVNVMLGNQYTLTATVTPANAANRELTWSSSNADVATVLDGRVTAKAIGTAVITAAATDGSGAQATCTVTVTPILVNSITLSQTTLTLTSGDSGTLSATVAPTNAANRSVTWSSSDTNVATVSATGVVSARFAGAAVITATAADGSGVKASCALTVNGKTQSSGVVKHPTIKSSNRYYRLYPTVKHLAYGATTTASNYAAIIDQFDVTWGENDEFTYGWYEAHTPLHPSTYCNYFVADVCLAMGAYFPLVNVCYTCGRPINSASFRSITASGSSYTTGHYMYAGVKADGLLCKCTEPDARDYSTGYVLKWFTGDDGTGEYAHLDRINAPEFGWMSTSKEGAIEKANAGYLTVGVNKSHVFIVYPNGSTSKMYISQAGSNLMNNEALPSSYTNYRYYYNVGM